MMWQICSVVALLGCVIEIISWRGYGLCFSLPAFVCAYLAYLAPRVDWVVMCILYVVMLILLLWAWFAYSRRLAFNYEAETFCIDSHNHLGKSFGLTAPVVDGLSRVELDQQIWHLQASHAALDVGTQVKVFATDGVVLRVKPLKDPTIRASVRK